MGGVENNSGSGLFITENNNVAFVDPAVNNGFQILLSQLKSSEVPITVETENALLFCKGFMDQASSTLYIIGVRSYRYKIQAVTVLSNGVVEPTSSGTIFNDFFVYPVSYYPQNYTVIITGYSTAKITITCDGMATCELYLKENEGVYHPIINGDEVKLNSTILYKAISGEGADCVLEINGQQQTRKTGEIVITKDTEFCVITTY